MIIKDDDFMAVYIRVSRQHKHAAHITKQFPDAFY